MKPKILFVQFTNPAAYPPLQHAALIFQKQGVQVDFICLRMSEGPQEFKSAPGTHFYWISNTSFRFMRSVIYFWFCLKSVGIAFFQKADWVYGSDHWTLPVLYLSKLLFHKKIIYHEHDSPTLKGSFWLRQILRLRTKVSRIADIKMVPNRNRIPPELKPESWTQVKNCPSVEEVLELPAKRKNALMLYYHGSINSVRMPLRLIEAFKLLTFPFHFKFAGYEARGGGDYIQQFLQTSKSSRLSDCVTYLGVLPTRQDLLKNCADCHVGMVFMPTKSDDINMAHMCGASNKPYDYLAAGCAVLVPDLSEWKKTYVDGGMGLACVSESAESIAAALKKFYESMQTTIDMGRRGREKILSDWNYEKQFEPVLKKMSEV